MINNNCIISACFNYGPEILERFLYTLRKFYDGDVVLIINEQNNYENLVTKYKTKIFKWETKSNLYAVERYKAYNEIVLSTNYQKYFFVDSRDVFFQDNPFVFDLKCNIEFYLEPSTISNCFTNSAWIESLYGVQVLNAIKENYIICSGTIRCTRNGAINFLANFLDEISSNLTESLLQAWDDQTIVNKIVHTFKIKNFALIPNATGTVQTMHHQNVFHLDRFSRILNDDLNICPVIHQWDRVSGLHYVFDHLCAPA